MAEMEYFFVFGINDNVLRVLRELRDSGNELSQETIETAVTKARGYPKDNLMLRIRLDFEKPDFQLVKALLRDAIAYPINSDGTVAIRNATYGADLRYFKVNSGSLKNTPILLSEPSLTLPY